MNKLLAVLISFVIFLSGCGETITEGEVIEKNYTPAHIQTAIIPVVHSNGKTSYTTLIPFIYYYADKWTITIRGYSDEGEEQTATYRVTEEVYNNTAVGSEFVYTEEMEPSNPEYTRERS